METRHNAARLVYHRRYPPILARYDSLLLGPDGEIVAAAPAQDNPHVTGLLPEDFPSGDDPGRAGGANPSPEAIVSTIVPSASSSITPASSISSQATMTQSSATSSTSSLSSAIASTAATSSASVLSSSSTTVSSTSSLSASSTTSLASSMTSSSSMAPTSSTRTTISSSSTTAAASASATPTSTAVANAVSSSQAHDMRLRVGIAVGTVAGIILVAILVVWYARRRSRAYREGLRENSSWPWDREKRPANPFRHSFGLRSAWVGGTDEHQKYDDIPRPASVVDRDAILPHQAQAQMGHSPYPTVQVPNACGSVPDLAPDMGRLQVANYVPGDVSGDDSRATSRANSLYSHNRPPSINSKKTSSLRNWIPAQPDAGPGQGLAIYEEEPQPADVTEWEELPLPGCEPTQPASAAAPESQSSRDIADHPGWATSFRSSLANAFHVVLGSSSSMVAMADQGHGDVPNADTAQGPQHAHQHAHDLQHDTIQLVSTPAEVLPDHQDVSRADDSNGNPFADPEVLTQRLNQVMAEVEGLVQVPPPETHPGNNEDVSHGLSRESSVYSAGSGNDRSIYTLPEVPMSRTDTNSSFQQAVLRNSICTPKASEIPAPREQVRRPSVHRSTTGSSTSSVGSDTSHTSSIDFGQLSDGEKYAQRMLRERRKRVTAAKINSVKQSLRRPSVRLGSRRGGRGRGVVQAEHTEQA